MLLNKRAAQVEVYNDLDGRLTRFFRVLREHRDELLRRLALTPYSELEFEHALEPSDDEIEQARRDFVCWRMSIGGRGDAFSYTLHRERGGNADVVNGFLSSIDDVLPLVVKRFRTVQIMNRPAIDVIKKWDSSETLIYCDPPYVGETRHESSRSVYAHEMTDAQHRELAAVLRACQSKVVISGYPSPLYAQLYGDWRQVEIDIANHAAGGKAKARKTEVLWLNY